MTFLYLGAADHRGLAMVWLSCSIWVIRKNLPKRRTNTLSWFGESRTDNDTLKHYGTLPKRQCITDYLRGGRRVSGNLDMGHPDSNAISPRVRIVRYVSEVHKALV